MRRKEEGGRGKEERGRRKEEGGRTNVDERGRSRWTSVSHTCETGAFGMAPAALHTCSGLIYI